MTNADEPSGPPGAASDVRPRSPDVALVGYGELGTKSSEVRSRMAERLRERCAALLAARGVDGEVERRWARLVVRTPDPDAAARAAADAFGAVWARPAIACEPTETAIVDALVALAERRRADGEGAEDEGTADGGPDPAPFAIRANRAGEHAFSARELKIAGGRAIQAATGAPVDLDDPAVVYRVDCRASTAFVSAVQYDGPGGLPLGTQGRAVALVSGGIDSPVAAYETMRRGCEVQPVYVGLGDYGGPDHEARAVETVRRLSRYAPGSDLRLRVVEAGDLVADLVERVDDTRMLSLRRAMVTIAATLATDADAHAVVTGEVLGQKSSQTGPNLAVTDAAVDLPIHRPLLTRDKADVTAQARRIGTYDDSTLPVGCDRVAPTHPATNATIEAVLAAEPDDLLVRAERSARERCRVVSLDRSDE